MKKEKSFRVYEVIMVYDEPYEYDEWSLGFYLNREDAEKKADKHWNMISDYDRQTHYIDIINHDVVGECRGEE